MKLVYVLLMIAGVLSSPYMMPNGESSLGEPGLSDYFVSLSFLIAGVVGNYYVKAGHSHHKRLSLGTLISGFFVAMFVHVGIDSPADSSGGLVIAFVLYGLGLLLGIWLLTSAVKQNVPQPKNENNSS